MMMMNLMFSGKSLDECLENASKELNVTKDKIDYKIIKEKDSLMGKKVQIEVIGTEIDSSNSNDSLDDEVNQIGARVENGKIIVTENLKQENSESITIKPCTGIKIFINGNCCSENMKYPITEYDKIEYESDKTECSRNVTVSISKDKMEGYICIEYIPEYTYKLKDKPTYRNLALKAIKIPGEYPKKYTVTEIKELLRINKITDGIIYQKLIETCVLGGNENVLIAKGTIAIDDTISEVKILFDIGEKNIIDVNSKENIDYKNINYISNIEEGQVLAEIIPGVIGQDGKNVCGEILKKKAIRNRPIKIGEGCKIEGNKIIATKTGRPSSKNGVICVNNMYKIQDVDMKSGNIYFVGDVNISGNVKEGMTVKSGRLLTIGKNVDVATIIARDGINIRGNAIKSTILTGQVDMEKKLYLDKLNEYKDNIVKLISAVDKLNESSKGSRKISELVKILIESRYKNIPKLSLGIITHNICIDSESSELADFIRNKMMGLNILKISSLNDLEILKELIENEIDLLEDNLIISADINLPYCQDSIVKATGSIIISDKGEYVSTLTAFKDIIFIRADAVARGGTISARGNIKLGTVGSPAGVTTKLEVLKDGVITANIAYSNTIFCFGNRCKTLDTPGKNVKAYMKEDGEIVINKFVL
ncbi:hypothetical protein psyc5s11_23030 [Clostridium gelidum]|uniref:RNA-binding protein KhpB N-terminal domain-containing protein n=1 Tax=Clostridium gelidum TaxID=704125 RepID=A0ABM7TB88_9CLOT|nr:FapA family protein [Clostridium gelidum]BCZ46236.1 hypothetical protein psyc5s11_23030 [Clostridium gelidum]